MTFLTNIQSRVEAREFFFAFSLLRHCLYITGFPSFRHKIYDSKSEVPMSINSNIYSEITESIIKQLENSTIAPWNQPWVSTRATSFATGKPYSYLNSMLLASSGEFITWAGIQAERKKAPNANIYLRKCGVQQNLF